MVCGYQIILDFRFARCLDMVHLRIFGTSPTMFTQNKLLWSLNPLWSILKAKYT